MSITHIVAMSENRVIGREGGIPWRLPEELRFFKRTTMGHALVMGRKTYESIGKPLPGRLNVVVSRDPAYRPASEEVVVRPTLAAAIAYCREQSAAWGEEVFVIGGGEIYRQSLELADRIYLTRVHATIDGDTFYPELSEGAFVRETIGGAAEPLAYTIERLDRRAPAGAERAPAEAR